MIITTDNFVWLNVTNKAEDLYDLFALYVLYDDESESLINSKEELIEALETGKTIGIEVGQL